MAPARPPKRQKPNLEDKTDDKPKAESSTPKRSTPPFQSEPSQDRSRSPWYRSWSRKAPSRAQMVDPSGLPRRDAASEVASIVNDRTVDPRASPARNPAAALTMGKSSLSRLLPVGATTTNVYATQTPLPTTDSGPDTRSEPQLLDRNATANKTSDRGSDSALPDVAVKPAPSTEPATEEMAQQGENAAESNKPGWFGWIAGREVVASQPPNLDGKQDVVISNGRPNTPEPTAKNTPSHKRLDVSGTLSPNSKRSWLQMLGSDASAKAGPVASKDAGNSRSNPEPASKDAENSRSNPQPASRIKSLDPTAEKPATSSHGSSLEAVPPPALPGDASKSSGWAFWSRERKANSSITASDDQPHIGELAISDTPSQNRPHKASISMSNDQPDKPESKPAKPAKTAKEQAATKTSTGKHAGKDPPPPTVEQKGGAKKSAGPKADKEQATAPDQEAANLDSKTAKMQSTGASAVAKEPSEITSTKQVSSSGSSRKSGRAHLLLPSLKDTLTEEESPSMLQQLTRLLYSPKQPEPRHLCIVKNPPRVRNALAIGVHGYFPAPMLRTFLGQPTGTSIKFADMAAKAIAKWTKARGYECEVKTAALEGEGRIAERVELLWKLLVNWIGEIRKADFVMVACHSQGVPVAIMLVAKLILFGCIPAARIGICAMAGVSMGPFVEYKSRWISGSAGELFEFSDPSSRVSEDYLAALDTVLREGVRLTYVGSIDDQLVSLESSIFAPVTHPHIFRAVSIDPRVHAPNFLSHLVGFVLKLRNLGAQDHGLIRELSSPLAGSLVTGEGHSRLYEDEAVYDLAVSFALETTALPDIPLIYRRPGGPASGGSSNPYVLPFAMRGILEEEFARNRLRHEADELLKQFDDWRPTTKVLKDVKFRLEGIRSKL
ncbi:hypothetical protein DV735_g2408, partial [Chaetothyriales sp. CBS 134920]